MLRSEGWVPTEFTETSGQAKIDEQVLLKIADKFPSAKLFAEQFTLQKRRSLLNSWIEAERDGRVHAQVIPNSAATSRTSSRNPNLQAVPAAYSAYGRECRKCFRASPGRVLLAADLDKAELMLLAHYMYAYDNGAYAAMLAESDIHQVNADAMGVSRALGKKVIFSMVYGASDKYIGEITGLSGKQVRSDLMEAFPALEQLMQQIRARVSGHSGFRALDKRWIACPAQFKALNYLLQSSTSIVGKQWAATAVERHALRNPDRPRLVGEPLRKGSDMSLYKNMNARKKAGTSRSKANSTVSDKTYKQMKEKRGGFAPKKKK